VLVRLSGTVERIPTTINFLLKIQYTELASELDLCVFHDDFSTTESIPKSIDTIGLEGTALEPGRTSEKAARQSAVLKMAAWP